MSSTIMKFTCVILAGTVEYVTIASFNPGYSPYYHDYDRDEMNIPFPKSYLGDLLLGKNTEQIKSNKSKQQKNFTRQSQRPNRTKQLQRRNKVDARINRWSQNRLNKRNLR